LFTFGAYAQIEVKSGLIVSGGITGFHKPVPAPLPENHWMSFQGDKKFDAAVGYKFRLLPYVKPFTLNPLFADLDIQAGYQQVKYGIGGEMSSEYHYNPDNLPASNRSSFKDNYYRLSLNPMLNCMIYAYWYVGFGVEPTLYLVSKSESKGSFSAFDIPLTARVGYDFKYVDLSFNYKYGLCDVTDTQYFTSGKIRRWQLQLFIPF
jgi:hypothetical protein